MKINVGFLMSYDYELLKYSIPLIYNGADNIVLALDEKKRTWSGNSFTVADSFFEWLKEFDTQNKIHVYQDDFYRADLSAMDNDSRERNMLAKQMGEGVCLQIDADEYFVDFEGFVAYLRAHEHKLNGSKPYQICPFLMDIYKVLDAGVLYSPELTSYYMGSNHPEFIRARKSKNQQKWYVPFFSIHQTWGRSEEELRFKLKNWGHNIDFDLESYLKFWKSIDQTNYKSHSNFHPLNDDSWKTLEYCEGETINAIVNKLKTVKDIPKRYIFWKNLGQRIKFLFQ